MGNEFLNVDVKSKATKKAKTILTYALLIIIFINMMPKLNVNANTEQQNILLDAFDGAIQVKHATILANGEMNSNSLKNTSILNNTSQLEDGIYMIDKGYGWIRGEEDFIQEGYAAEGDTLALTTTKTVGSSHKVNMRIGAGIKYQMIETFVTVGYGYSWSNAKSINVGFRAQAKNKELYAKVYSISRRWDTIEVLNGKIIAGNQSYQPYGSWLKKIEYEKGTELDLNKFNETQVRCVTDSSTSNYEMRTVDNAQRLLTDYNGNLIDDAEVVILEENQINPLIAEKIMQISEDGTSVVDNNIDPLSFNSNINSLNRSALLDGYYAIDYGKYWISPNDAGVIHTFVIPENSTAIYEEKVKSSTVHSTDVSYNLKINVGIVLFTLNAMYGHTWESSYSENISLQINSTSTEAAFSKIYTVNQRVDIIQVQNGKIVARNISYQPHGFKSEKMYYNTQDGCNQKKLYVTEPYSVFNVSEKTGSGIIPIDSDAIQPSLINFNADSTASFEENSTFQFSNSSTGMVPQIVQRFTVSHSGIYDIGYYIQQATSVFLWQNYSGWIGTWSLYEANAAGSKLGMKIGEITTNPPVVVATNTFEKTKNDLGFNYYSGYSNNVAMKSIVLEADKEYVFVMQPTTFLGNYVGNGTKSYNMTLNIVGRKKSTSVRKSNVSFFTNNGTSVPMQTVTLGRTILEAPVSTKNNMQLEGWYYNMNLTDKFNFGIDIISEATLCLYARWVNEIYDGLKYIEKVNTNSISGSTIFAHTGNYEILENSLYEGKTAVKIKSGEEGVNGTTSFTFKGDQFEIYGDYNNDQYRLKITIDGKELSEQPYIKSSNESKNNLIYRSTVLEHGGEHTVTIQAIDASAIIDYVRIIQIVSETYNVIYDLNGGSGNISPQTVPVNSLLTKPVNNPTKEGYIFDEWYLDNNFTNKVDFSTLRISNNTILYAKWKDVESYALSFDLNGAQGFLPNQRFKIGELVQEPTDIPENLGYTFNGWFFDKEGLEPVNFNNFILEKDTTIYASWKALPINTVTFELNGGYGDFPEKQAYYGASIDIPSILPTKSGYQFVGWYTDKSLTNIVSETTLKVYDNVTLYARWKSDNNIIISFNLNAGTGNFADLEIESGQKISISTVPTKDGYEFNGWYEDASLTLSVDLSEKIFTQNTTLYASWKVVGSYYTIYFDLINSAANMTPRRQTIPEGFKVEEPVVYPAPGYEFDGWYFEKTYVNKVDFNTWIPKKDTLIYAKWKLTY